MNNLILLLLIAVILYLLIEKKWFNELCKYYSPNERFENDQIAKKMREKECSGVSLSNAIFGYSTNTINRGAR